jgi:hypothetical protein
VGQDRQPGGRGGRPAGRARGPGPPRHAGRPSAGSTRRPSPTPIHLRLWRARCFLRDVDVSAIDGSSLSTYRHSSTRQVSTARGQGLRGQRRALCVSAAGLEAALRGRPATRGCDPRPRLAPALLVPRFDHSMNGSGRRRRDDHSQPGLSGVFDRETVPRLGLPGRCSQWTPVYRAGSALKAGVTTGDLITTVSPTYA